jgi:uncharacterized membrane-anchored protein
MSRARHMLNKVPEVTLYFWVIKVLCTTVGETFADFLSGNVGLGETGTAIVMSVVLIAALVWQFSKDRYVPPVYWLAVVLISIVGTLITDNMVDKMGVSLVTETVIWAVLLATTFAVWYGFERTLSIHTIFTRRREAFYWLAILFTFALGTAGGDLLSEKLALGYWVAAGIFAGAIALVAFSHYVLRLNAVLAFWLAYILTRPLGASIGDGMSQSDGGGLNLGTTVTSLVFLGAILALVVYLTRSRVDEAPPEAIADEGEITTGPHVLVVTDHPEPAPTLLDAVKARALRGQASFEVLVPNPAPADWHPSNSERYVQLERTHKILDKSIPAISEAAGASVSGDVSIRHDPMDVIEEALNSGSFDEIIVAMHPQGPLAWLHVDLPHRVAHLGLPLTTVSASA